MAIKQPSTKDAYAMEGGEQPLDVVTLILRDHLHVEQMLNDLRRMGPDADKSDLVPRLLEALEVHEKAEEKAFYPRIRPRIPNGEALVSKRLEEQRQAGMLVSRLRAMPPANPEFEPLLLQLLEASLHHATEEEKEIIPLVLESFHAPDLLAMADDWKAAKAAEQEQWQSSFAPDPRR